MNQKYKVWGPALDDTGVDVFILADCADAAAEAFAEEDREGQADCVYDEPCGHLLHVQDDDGELWEVRVALQRMPVGITLKSSRL